MGFSVPYFVISPTALLSFIGLLKGPDKTIATPNEDWKKATIDVIIPALNEERNIILCLQSLITQTHKVKRIFVYDDASQDATASYAKKFSNTLGIECVVIKKEKATGKTASLKHAANISDSDILFVLDGDTVLRSNQYIEYVVRELYQGIGNASCSGTVLPLMKQDRQRIVDEIQRELILREYPNILKEISTFDKLQYALTNYYREELYLFLQKFIYHGEMTFFGTIVNPVGCAVAYRRLYLKRIFDDYEEDLGNNLTTSEDVFLGFAFINAGYKNIHLKTVYALTEEPKFSQLPHQILNWSSSYLQCCYYFDDLVSSPFKLYKTIFKKSNQKTINELRKIKEPYRQAFGTHVTEKYGRPIGWYIFTAALEKCSFPFILILMVYYGLWEILTITFIAEIILYTSLIIFFHQNRRVKNIFKSIVLTPIRYMILLFDVYVISNFLKDIYFTEKRTWTK